MNIYLYHYITIYICPIMIIICIDHLMYIYLSYHHLYLS